VFSSFGPTELIIVLVIVLLIFGPKRLPGLGRSLGSGMREFKDSVTGGKGDDDDDEAGEGEGEGEAERRPALERPVTTDETPRAVDAEPVRERTPQS
jgi:sec-independent protein translocase protein TatA